MHNPRGEEAEMKKIDAGTASGVDAIVKPDVSLFLCVKQVPVIDHKATGEYARKARKREGLSLREVARRMGMSAAFISDLERGNRNWTEELAAKYGRTIGYFGKA